jgi:flagellar basal body rod protein FlgG
MPDYDAWLSTTTQYAPTASSRADDAYRRIQDKPSTVAVWRAGAYHHDETVRIEWGNGTNVTPSAQSPNTVAAITEVVLFGINGHDTETDTDIVEGDEIALSGESFVVKDSLITTGELQARAVRIT